MTMEMDRLAPRLAAAIAANEAATRQASELLAEIRSLKAEAFNPTLTKRSLAVLYGEAVEQRRETGQTLAMLREVVSALRR